jgi:hypothetical protein
MYPLASVDESDKGAINAVADNMRAADVRELWLSHRMKPREALHKTFDLHGPHWTGRWAGQPVAMFGIATSCSLTKCGTPWMLATDEMLEHKREFLYMSKKYMKIAEANFNYLENYVHEDNEASIKWLQWLGFEIMEKERYGLGDGLFHKFKKRLK